MAHNNRFSTAKLSLVWWEITLIVVGIKCFVAILLGCRKRHMNETISETSSETLSTIV